MVRKEVLLRTVQRMHDSGISDEEISKTLTKFGLSADEVKNVLKEVGSSAEVPAQRKLEDAEHEEIADKTARRVKEEIAADREAGELRESTVHTAISGQENVLKEILNALKRLETKGRSGGPENSTPQVEARLSTLEKRLTALEKSTDETLAASRASQDLLKKVLEASRNALHKK